MISRRVLLAAVPLLASGTAVAAVAAAKPISRLDTGWWRARHQAKLVELRAARPDLLWLGDSITQNFERNGPEPWARFRPVWDRSYAPLRAVNLGFKGDATSHLLWRLQNGELDGIAPRAAVMLIGANNLGRLHWSAEDSVSGVAACVAEVRRRLPATRILLLGVLPSDRTAWASQTTAEINAALPRRIARSDASFLDLSSLFAPGGRLDHGLFYDGMLSPPEPALHPTADGMARLAAAIQPTLTSLLA